MFCSVWEDMAMAMATNSKGMNTKLLEFGLGVTS